MIKIERLKIVETEADWMIYSNLQEKLLLSPEPKFRLVVPNKLECNASLVLTPPERERKKHIKYRHGWTRALASFRTHALKGQELYLLNNMASNTLLMLIQAFLH